MVKKSAAKAGPRARRKDDNQLAAAIRDSAQHIWLAGVGAFAKAREERTKFFDALVKEGRNIQLRTRALAEERIGEVTERVQDVKERATESWDKLEQVFENRVARALNSLGVPTKDDVAQLSKRVAELKAEVEKLNGKAKSAAPKAKPAAKAAKPRAPRKATVARAATAAKAAE